MPIGISFLCYSSVVQRRSTKMNQRFDFSLRRSILPDCRKNFTKRRFAYGGLGKLLSFSLCRFVENGLCRYKSEMNCRVSSLLVDQSVTKRTGVCVPPRFPHSSKLTCCFNSSVFSFGR